MTVGPKSGSAPIEADSHSITGLVFPRQTKKWRTEFAGMGKALGGGAGWVLLMWSPRAGRLVNQWAADHSMTLADGVGLLALDMYEHAYHMDYGSNAGAYVDAFMNVLDWRNANTAFAAAL